LVVVQDLLLEALLAGLVGLAVGDLAIVRVQLPEAQVYRAKEMQAEPAKRLVLT
jgi:hypothetical protein